MKWSLLKVKSMIDPLLSRLDQDCTSITSSFRKASMILFSSSAVFFVSTSLSASSLIAEMKANQSH